MRYRDGLSVVQQLEQIVAGEPHGFIGCLRPEATRHRPITTNCAAEVPCFAMNEAGYLTVLANGTAQVRLTPATEEIVGLAYWHRSVEHAGNGRARSNAGPDRIVRRWRVFARSYERGKRSQETVVRLIHRQWECPVQKVLDGSKDVSPRRILVWQCPKQKVHEDHSAGWRQRGGYRCIRRSGHFCGSNGVTERVFVGSKDALTAGAGLVALQPLSRSTRRQISTKLESAFLIGCA